MHPSCGFLLVRVINVRPFIFSDLHMTLMLMFICLQRSISFNLWVDMVWHIGFHSRLYSILRLLIMHQDYTAIALLLFTALPLISVAVAAFFYVRNNER